MSKKQYSFLAALIILSGLAGGALSSLLLTGASAWAGEIRLTPTVDRMLPRGTDSQPAQQGQEKIIRTERLELVDQRGQVVGHFGLRSDGTPNLSLYDKQGAVALSCGVNPDGNPLLLVQGPGGSKLLLGVGADGDPTLSLQDKKDHPRIALRLAADGSPMLAFLDEHGRIRSIFRLGADGNALLACDDETGKTRLVIGSIVPAFFTGNLPAKDISSLTLFDKNEKVIWQAP
jgi:hypothetical protein